MRTVRRTRSVISSDESDGGGRHRRRGHQLEISRGYLIFHLCLLAVPLPGMASGQPFLTLLPVPPLDLTTNGDETTEQVGARDDSSPSIESYSTAQDSTDAQSRMPIRSPTPSPSLRKSISVDSFAQYNQKSPVLSGPRPNRGHTGSALEPPRNIVYGVSSSLQKEREEQIQATRNQGVNDNSTKDGKGSSLHDSDVERSDTLGSPVERYRHTSPKPQDHAKPVLRGGELPLPSRTPTLSTTSSLSSVVSDLTTNSSTLDDALRSLSSTSLQLPRQGSMPVAAPGRARSGSLGVYSPRSLKRPTTSSYIVSN